MTTIGADYMTEATAEKWQRYLEINLEGKLLQESQDICEELMILLRVYSQQITVIKEFRRHLATLKEEETRTQWLLAEKARRESRDLKGPADDVQGGGVSESAMIGFSVVQKMDRLLSWHLNTSMSPFSDNSGDHAVKTGKEASGPGAPPIPTQDADMLLELVDSRRLELQELEEAASRTCKQVCKTYPLGIILVLLSC